MKAKVERFRNTLVGDMATRERAKLPCGCCIFVGRRTDTHEVSTMAKPCSEDHELLIELANGMLREGTRTPKKRLLVNVCADYLTQAAKQA